MAACQLSRALGLKVLGTAGTPEGLKLALSNGAHLAFNHREEGYTDRIMVHTRTHTHAGTQVGKELVTSEGHQALNLSITFLYLISQ